MKIKIQQAKLETFVCDFLVLKWVQGQKMDGSAGDVNRALRGALEQMMKEQGFKGKEGEAMIFSTFGKIAAKKVMVLGLGEQQNVTIDLIRRSAARAVQEARKQHARKVGMLFFGTGTARLNHFDAAQAITEGALLGGYTYHKYKSAEARKENIFPTELTIVTTGDLEKIHVAKAGIRQGEICAQATIFARDLVNEPSSNMTPKILADIACSLTLTLPSPQGRGVGGEGTIEAKIFNREQCEKMGMGAYLGVARGSDHEPYFIHLVYKPQGSVTKRRASSLSDGGKIKCVAIVGKGITFDSGGLSIKRAGDMEDMKGDMAGCAVMLGVFHALAQIQPNVEVHGISAVCENMPSGKALKPGDILKTMAGKNIEVLNTDAEGRLTLVDALTYVIKNIKPDAIVDLATLTGACVVALGEEVAGYMGNNTELLARVKQAAIMSGERVWELPLVEEYKEMLKSNVADYCNSTAGKKGAGAIVAGLLLQEFVGKVPWVHLDIAGPAWAEKDVISYMPKGGTGFGVRMMLELLKKMEPAE